MRNPLLALLIGVIAMMMICCDDAFNPNAPYKDRLVVFAVFSNRSDTQYVRLHTTFPVTTNPLAVTAEALVPDAYVTVTQGTRTYTFRDTVLSRSDTGRYRSPVRAFVAYHFPLEPALRYQLSVASPSKGTATAQATSLFRATLLNRVDFNGAVIVQVQLGQANVRAWIVRMFLEYEVRIDTTWVLQRIEVPRLIDAGTRERIYPKPLPTNLSSTIFSPSVIGETKSELRQQFGGARIRLLRTVFILTQMDEAFFAYYSTVNGFPDSGTLRLDEPDYTNITGGLGVFAMSTETIATGDTTGN